MKDKKRRERITRKEYRRLLNKFGLGGFMAQKGLWNLARERENAAGQRCIAKGKKVTLLETIRRCMRQISGAVG